LQLATLQYTHKHTVEAEVTMCYRIADVCLCNFCFSIFGHLNGCLTQSRFVTLGSPCIRVLQAEHCWSPAYVVFWMLCPGLHCKNQQNCGNRLQAILLIQFNKLELSNN